MKWTFVIPYFNEVDYLGPTLASLIAQTVRPFRLILVDNGSTDGSAALAQMATAGLDGIDVIHLTEPRPGKIYALEIAMPQLRTELAAFGDADTWYPPHYLAAAERAFANGGTGLVAVMAVDVTGPPDRLAVRGKVWWRGRVMGRLLAKQTHTGGFGQTFRTDAFRAAGGYAARHWDYVLLDHEVMQRVLKQGRAAYPADLWCIPSPRRSNRRRVRWTLGERLLYHLTPFAAKDWYFYRFLGPRLARRRLTQLRLREKPWEAGGK